jgi:hypothetical protein
VCLNCGCGNLTDNHGDSLNITLSRLRLIAQRNDSTMTKQATNIAATLFGEITKTKPLGDDKIEISFKRIPAEPKPQEAKYVDRTRTRLTKKSKRSVGEVS